MRILALEKTTGNTDASHIKYTDLLDNSMLKLVARPNAYPFEIETSSCKVKYLLEVERAVLRLISLINSLLHLTKNSKFNSFCY